MEREERIGRDAVNRREEVYIRWEYPREGWVKLNVDGAPKGNPGEVGAGGILRDSSGAVYGMFAANCGRATSTKSELLAVLRGLALT